MNAALAAASPLVSRVETVRTLVLGGVAALAAIGLLLVTRRIAGALSAELGVAPMLATLTLAAAIVFAGRVAWRRVGEVRGDPFLAWGGTAALVLVGAGCAWPGSGSYAWLSWLPLVGADFYSRRLFLRGDVGSVRDEIDAAGVPPLASPFEGGEVILQELLRVRGDDGVEAIRGTLRTEYVAGQRHATLFVGFCPPLDRLPDVDAELVDGPDGTVKIVQAFAHGARLDVRLSEPAEEACCVAVELCAAPSAPLPRRG